MVDLFYSIRPQTLQIMEGTPMEDVVISPPPQPPPTSSEKAKGKMNRRYLGIFLASLAAVMYSFSALIIKILHYHPFSLGVWRFSIMILLTLPFLVHGQFFSKGKEKQTDKEDSTPGGILHQIWPINRVTGFLLLQAVFVSNSVLFVFFGVNYLDIGDSIVIGTSAPVFVTFVAWVFLKERCGVVPVLLALLALFGVAIICKPQTLLGSGAGIGIGGKGEMDTFKGVCFSFASMILLTLSYVIIRFLRKVHHAFIQLAFGLWGLLESVAFSLAFGVFIVPQNTYEMGLILGSALLAFSAQTCLTHALKYEQAGVVALVRTTEVPFCFLWQFLFLHSKPDIFSVVGAAITLGCVIIAALRKSVMSLEEGHPYRKTFAFLLY